MALVKPFSKSHSVGVGVTEWFLPGYSLFGRSFLRALLFGVGPDGAGTAKVQTTMATRVQVIADNANPGTIPEIMPIDWPAGLVTANTHDKAEAVTAYRIEVTAGNVFVNVRGV